MTHKNSVEVANHFGRDEQNLDSLKFWDMNVHRGLNKFTRVVNTSPM